MVWIAGVSEQRVKSWNTIKSNHPLRIGRLGSMSKMAVYGRHRLRRLIAVVSAQFVLWHVEVSILANNVCLLRFSLFQLWISV